MSNRSVSMLKNPTGIGPWLLEEKDIGMMGPGTLIISRTSMGGKVRQNCCYCTPYMM